jgi:predicted permease
MTFFSRSRMDREIHEELRTHIEMRADDLEKTGLGRAEAERRARIEFGGELKFKEETRAAAGLAWLETVIQDVRFSLRVLRKSPGFALTAIVTLALGIGANAIVFSVVNAFILRPLNVPDAETLYQLERGKDKAGAQSYPDYRDLRDRNRSFDDLAAYDITLAGLDTGDGNPTRVWVDVVTGNYFDALHLQPFLGRYFHGADEHGAGSASYAVLTHEFWHAHFHDDPSVVGHVIRINRRPVTILGVTPPDFHGTMLFFGPQMFVPLVHEEPPDATNRLNARAAHWLFQVVGHLRPGVTVQQAVADLNAIGADLERTYPKDDAQMTFTLARPGLYGDYLGPVVQGFLLGMMLLAALILVAACANLGSLFAARAADRAREVALRLALGAGRARIVRQLLTEAVVIALIGGSAGLALSLVVLRGLSAWQPFERFPIHVVVTPDAKVYLVALLVTLASGLLFGAVPIRQVLRTGPFEIVKGGPIGVRSRRVAIRDLLLVAQLAICAVLVTSSLVAIRGLVRSTHSRFGFDPHDVLLVDTDLGMAGYASNAAAAAQKRILDALAALPGVASVGYIDQPPLWVGVNTFPVYDDRTTDLRPANAAGNPAIYHVSPDYFRAAGTRMLSGRSVGWHDDANAPLVAVVNQQFVRKMLGSVDPIGAHFKLRGGRRVEVVGLVEDGKYESLTEHPLPVMFVSFQQLPSTAAWFVLRSARNPQELARAARTALLSVDSALPVTTETWDSELNSGAVHFGPRVASAALGVLGAMAALLSVTGIFGLAAYSLSRRTREIGIRIALGANNREVLQTVLGRSVKLIAIGSVAGVVLGLLASRVLGVIVYQATPRDPIVLTGVALAMALLAVIGTWIPAHRALAVSPLLLMRDE